MKSVVTKRVKLADLRKVGTAPRCTVCAGRPFMVPLNNPRDLRLCQCMYCRGRARMVEVAQA